MIMAALIVICIGVFLAFLCRNELMLTWQSRRWPQVMGQIVDTEITEGVGVGVSETGTGAPADHPFRIVEKVYAYCVSEKSYRSSRLSFSARGWIENEQYYEDGSQVPVYYCPTDPSIAVLKPG